MPAKTLVLRICAIAEFAVAAGALWVARLAIAEALLNARDRSEAGATAYTAIVVLFLLIAVGAAAVGIDAWRSAGHRPTTNP